MTSTHIWKILFVPAAVLATISCSADSDSRDNPVDILFADSITSAPGAGDGKYQDPDFAIDGVHGAGDGAANAVDVYSLGLQSELVLEWAGLQVVNGPGTDFVVFENCFRIGATEQFFMEPAIIEFSNDQDTWVSFPFDYLAQDETLFSRNPEDWSGFAGIRPVLYHQENNPVDPFDPAVSGGDHFDLDLLSADSESSRDILENGFRYLRIRSSATELNPDTGEPFVQDDVSNGPDIDGVVARYFE